MNQQIPKVNFFCELLGHDWISTKIPIPLDPHAKGRQGRHFFYLPSPPAFVPCCAQGFGTYAGGLDVGIYWAK